MLTKNQFDRVVQTLDSGNNKYYVYALCLADGTPFYIGKGCGRRVEQHRDAAVQAQDAINNDETLTTEEKDQKKKLLTTKLQTIIDQHGDMKMVIVKWGLSEEEAFMCESALINLLSFAKGRTIIELTNIVDGHASRAEKNCPSDDKTKARTLETFLQECAIKELSVDGIPECVALIKINDFYPKCRTEDGSIDVEKVKECARGIWHIGQYMNDRVKYIFALYHGRVVGIFHVTGVSQKVSVECRGKAIDYPRFPIAEREAELLALGYSSLESAKKGLSPVNYEKVDAFLARVAMAKKRDKKFIFDDLKERVYFKVDDDVPERIMAYMNSIAIGDDDVSKFRCQAPVQYNHK